MSNGEIQKRLPDAGILIDSSIIVNQILSQDLTSHTFNNMRR